MYSERRCCFRIAIYDGNNRKILTTQFILAPMNYSAHIPNPHTNPTLTISSLCPAKLVTTHHIALSRTQILTKNPFLLRITLTLSLTISPTLTKSIFSILIYSPHITLTLTITLTKLYSFSIRWIIQRIILTFTLTPTLTKIDLRNYSSHNPSPNR